MNIIFLTLVRITDLEDRGLYQDLMRKFRDEGHEVYIVTPCERRMGQETNLIESGGAHILNVRTLNVQKTNIVEKGIGTLLLESQYKAAIQKFLGNIKFDLITYSTPPITFTNVVNYLKRKNPGAITYLQLKDIFPQNAVDIGLMPGSWFTVQRSGLRMPVAFVKYLLYKYFRKKETKLYAVSDYIGCMSPANVKFLLDHNPEVDASRVEVAPNSVELMTELSPSEEMVKQMSERDYIREKYHLPKDKPVFIYGGNLGKPQGIPYLIECLEANKNREDCFFIVVGTGTELSRVTEWYESQQPPNVVVMKGLPKDDYDMLVRSCDVGLIFLDHRFTIPNYPSRLLSYLENKMPVICATDVNTDIGKLAEENGYGYWCESVKPADFTALVDKMLASDRKAMGKLGYKFLKKNYLVEHTYNVIMKHIK